MDAAVDLRPAVRSAAANDGRLELVFAPDAEGRSFLAHQFAAYPFHVCRAQYLDPEAPAMASLYLQSSSGGLFAGDRLSLSIAAEPGARAHVTTPASTIVHRMPEGEARLTTRLEAGAGSLLEYLPDPLILFPQARLRSTLHLRLGAGATAILADSFLPHDPAATFEPFGVYESETEVADADGRLLMRDRFRVLGAEAQTATPGVMGGRAMQATILAVGSAVAPAALLSALRREMAACAPAVYGAASLLPNSGGAWARLLADDGAELTDAVLGLWAAAREAITGSRPQPRRK